MNSKDECMQTRRSFLAFAAAAQLAGPRAARPAAARPLPRLLLQTHGACDVHFCTDLVPGRLVVLSMVCEHGAAICAPRGSGRDAFMYALTEQRAISRPADLRRFMDAYGDGEGWRFLRRRPGEVELLRFRLGLYQGGEDFA
jgi:protein SCO1/2